MANITFMMSLHMQVGGVIKPRQLHWYERVFTGERFQFSLSYNEVRDRPIFPMYAELRGRAIHLADAPAELVVHFTHSDNHGREGNPTSSPLSRYREQGSGLALQGSAADYDPHMTCSRLLLAPPGADDRAAPLRCWPRAALGTVIGAR